MNRGGRVATPKQTRAPRTPTRPPASFFHHLKDWWWLYGVGTALCSFIVLWGNIPPRLAKAEEKIEDLKGWAKEIQGYTRAQQEMNQHQQAPNQAAPQQRSPILEWQDPDTQAWWWCNSAAEDCDLNESWSRTK